MNPDILIVSTSLDEQTVAAPNILSATVVPFYPVYNNVEHWVLSGVISLPYAASGFAPVGGAGGLQYLVDVGIVGPAVNPTPTIEIAGQLNGPFTGICNTTASGNLVTGLSGYQPASINGLSIQINGTIYNVASIVAPASGQPVTSVTLTTSPGNQTGVQFSWVTIRSEER